MKGMDDRGGGPWRGRTTRGGRRREPRAKDAASSYAMSVFKIPKKIVSELQMRWRNIGGVMMLPKRECTLFAWWKMCVPKKEGGMRFRDIHNFNLALLAKQAWRLIDNPKSLCATILRAKYFLDGDLLNATLKKKESYT